jgi:hypothetical protein
LPTLVIADLDSAEPTGHHRAVRPERGKGLISSNYAITGWFFKDKKDKDKTMDKLIEIPAADKEFILQTPYKHAIRIAYQTPVMINYEGKRAALD